MRRGNRQVRLQKLACAALVLGSAPVLISAPAAGNTPSGYAQVITNDMRQCSPGNGPALRVSINGIRSSAGNLFVRTYKARSSDWLKSKRYLTRLDAQPRAGAMTVCVPLEEPGRYAVAVQHDANGNREVDFSTDGVAMSNNPNVPRFIGIPIPPSVKKTAFNAGPGVTRVTVTMRYRQ